MRIKQTTKQEHWLRALSTLLLGLGMASVAGCSSGESATGTRQVESPHGIGASDAGDADGGTHGKDGGSDGGSAYATGEAWGPHHGWKPETWSEFVERAFGLTLSAEGKLIADDCPRRPWSKNVPQRACKKDDECGDGFCDRGQCSAIYTCRQDIGSRCELDGQCPYMLCIDGRCRSCVSDEECQIRMEHSDRICSPPTSQAPRRECTGLRGNYTFDRKAVCVSGVNDLPLCNGAEKVAPKPPKPTP